MNNSSIRARAHQLVSQHWGKMICMALLIGVAYLGATLVVSLISGLFSGISATLAAILMIVFSVVICIAGSGLMLGYNGCMLQLHDGKSVRASDVFSYLGNSLPAFGLGLWIGLWVFLWMLPGMAVMLIGALIGGAMDSEALTVLLMIVGYVAIFVCVLRAAFSYSMANYALADKPSMGVRAAMNKSKELMNGRRWQLFCLTVPYALISIGASLLVSLLVALCSGSQSLSAIIAIIGMLIMIVACVVISLYTAAAYASFYKALNPSAAPSDTDGFPADQPSVSFDFNF